MALKFFTVPVQDSFQAEAEVNAFLANHKVLTVDRRWVELGPNSYWALCVDYLPGGSPGNVTVPGASNRSRVDYKQILSPEEFALFAKLRDLRKEIAQAEAVPVYTIFTNEQLAQVVQQRVRSRDALAKIDGIGEARTAKYGDRLLAVVNEHPESRDETDGQPVRENPGT